MPRANHASFQKLWHSEEKHKYTRVTSTYRPATRGGGLRGAHSTVTLDVGSNCGAEAMWLLEAK